MTLKTRVIELEPGWLLVAFKGAKPRPEKRAFWLRKTLEDWLGDNPGQKVQRTLPVTHRGQHVGVHVWLGESPPARREVSLRVKRQVFERLPKEHLEAICQHAYDIYFKQAATSAAQAVVNGRALLSCLVANQLPLCPSTTWRWTTS